MEENKQLRIGFGALVPPIAKQLKEQGLKFDAEEVKHFEKLRESIVYLQFADLINDKAREKAMQKLFNRIYFNIQRLISACILLGVKEIKFVSINQLTGNLFLCDKVQIVVMPVISSENKKILYE